MANVHISICTLFRNIGVNKYIQIKHKTEDQSNYVQEGMMSVFTRQLYVGNVNGSGSPQSLLVLENYQPIETRSISA
jgi:hypothetical protein